MSMIRFTVDARPYRGYQTVFINPDEVSSVESSDSTDNPTKISMKSGTIYHVKGWPDETCLKLAEAKGDAKP